MSAVGKHNLIINSSVANTKLILSSNTSYICGGTNNLLFSTSSSLKKHLEDPLNNDHEKISIKHITKKYRLKMSPQNMT